MVGRKVSPRTTSGAGKTNRKTPKEKKEKRRGNYSNILISIKLW
jgi:hypothetical protein